MNAILVIAPPLLLLVIFVVWSRTLKRQVARRTEDLQESEERYRAVAEDTPVLICRFLPGGEITFVNDAYCKYFAKTSKELVGQTFFSLILETDLETVMAKVSSLTVESPMQSHEHRVIAPDGEIHWQRWTNRALFDAQGKTVAFQSIGEDITERKRAEERIEGLNRLNQDLLGSGSLAETMNRITDGVVDILGADFARIWITKKGDLCDSGCMHAEVSEGPHVCRDRTRCLHLVASSGRYTHIDGETHRRVPFGCYKIGRVATAEEPGFLTNDVLHDPRVHNHDWARELGLKSFAGYRLVSREGAPIGVLALFSKQTLSPNDDVLLQTIAGTASEVILISESMEALRSEKLLSEEYINSLPGLFYVFDETRFVTWNTEWDRTGYSAEELGSKYGTDFFEGQDRALIEERMLKVFREGAAEAEAELVTKDGRRIPYFFTGLRKEFDGKPHLVGLGIDITELKRAEEATRKAQAALLDQQRHETERVETQLAKVRDELVRTTRLAAIGQVAASIAHELRNPLGAAGNACYFLKRYGPDDEAERDEYLDIINRELQTAHSVIDGLLSMARAKEPTKDSVNFGNLLNEVFQGIRTSDLVTCRVSLTPEPFVVQADPNQLRQVVTNLVKNALQAMPNQQGELLVEASRQPNGDTIVFRDTGPGLAPAILKMLFEPLLTTKAKGTGLGLTICRQIVERHGGTIDAANHGEGGAVFTICLPRG